MRYLTLLTLGVFLASNAYADSVKKTVCAQVISANLSVKESEVYIDVNARINSGKSIDLKIKKDNDTDGTPLKFDGKYRYITYDGTNIINIGSTCS